MEEQDHSKVARWRRRPVRTALAALVIVLGALVLASVVGSAPAVCGACHGDQRTALAASAHAETGCYGCHLDGGAWSWPRQKTDELFRMYPAALAGRDLTRPADPTSRGACLTCHADILTAQTDGARLRVDHAACAQDATCDGCHATTAHDESVRWRGGPVMEDCVACHSERDIAISCETCHAEGGDRGASDAPNGPWQVTHGPDWEQTHGLGDTDTCIVCHPKDYCVRCHGVQVPHPPDFGGTHGSSALEAPEACARCHPSREAFCDSCHPMEMPHPDGFLAGHGTIAASDADPRCFACHADNDCGNCHSAHIHPGGAVGVPVPWTLTPEERRP